MKKEDSNTKLTPDKVSSSNNMNQSLKKTMPTTNTKPFHQRKISGRSASPAFHSYFSLFINLYRKQ
jgi:hypothetical protein